MGALATAPTKTARWPWVGLALVLLLALALRAATAALPRVIRWDEPDYLWLGRSLWLGEGYTINGAPELHYTPLYALLAGGLWALVGDAELASSFWYVLLGALTVAPVYAIAARLYGRRVGLTSALLAAVFPGLSSAILYWGTFTEPLFILLIYGALWAALVALEGEAWWRYALVGGLLTLAYLARPEGLLWLLAFAFLFVLIWAYRRRLWRWRTLLYLGAYLAACLIVAAPYLAYVHRHTGKWMATGKLGITYDIGQAVLGGDEALYDQVTASLDEATGEILWWSGRRFQRSFVQVLADDPLAAGQRVWRNAQRAAALVLGGRVLPLFLLAPMLLGWCRAPWDRRRMEHEAALWCAALPVLSFLLFHIEVRFFSPAFPAVLIWTAAGLAQIGRWADETRAAWSRDTPPAAPLDGPLGRAVAWTLAAVLVAYFGLAGARTVQAGMASLNDAHKAAGLWLREQTPPDAAVMSRDLAISIYAERGFVVSPRTEYRQYLEYARRKGATYLVVDERELTVLRPHLAFLLDDTDPPPELEPALSLRDRHGLTLIYRLKD
ncbi:MAG: glycosyltransferase family 39 protein [Chloroflexota bacterium]